MTTDLAISVRRALPADASTVAAFINQVYKVESFFVDGDRTSAAEILEMMERGHFIVLEHSDGSTGGLAAAVYMEISSQTRAGYLGMLSVAPAFQKHGLGKRLVRIVEALCEASGCVAVDLRIINLREELNRWYRSLGYEDVGTLPYEHRPVKQPVHFVLMRKILRSVTVTEPRAPGAGAVAA